MDFSMGYGVSFMSDEHVCNQIEVMVAQYCDCTRCH